VKIADWSFHDSHHFARNRSNELEVRDTSTTLTRARMTDLPFDPLVANGTIQQRIPVPWKKPWKRYTETQSSRPQDIVPQFFALGKQ